MSEDGAGSTEGGATRAQAHEEHKTGSNERSAPETQGGSNKRDDEAAGQRTMELQDGRQATAAGAKAEVVQSKAGEGKTRRTRTDLGMDGNGLSTPARGNGNDSDGKAREKMKRTPTRGKIYKIGSLDSSGGGRATTEGAPGGGAPTSGRSSGWGRARHSA